jgi:hypothetical protein
MTKDDPKVDQGTHLRPRPSILLVREWEQQMSSSGCCGRLQGDLLLQGGDHIFVRRREIMEEMGPLYRSIRAELGDQVELRVVDPRNFPALLVILLRDARRHGLGWRGMIRTLSGLTVQTVVVNGRIFARGSWPDPETFCREVKLLASSYDETEGRRARRPSRERTQADGGEYVDTH